MKTPLFYPLIFGLLALLAYTLPWVTTPASGLTLGAYDLAEWVSLHPSARMASPPLLPALLLRFGLVCVILLMAFSHTPKFAKMLIVIIGAIALLPPLEFFSSGLGDSNYRQQFALAVLVLLLGLAGSADVLRRWSASISIALAVLLAVSAVWGNVWGYNLMLEYRLPVQFAAGGWLFAALGMLWLGSSWLFSKQTG